MNVQCSECAKTYRKRKADNRGSLCKSCKQKRRRARNNTNTKRMYKIRREWLDGVKLKRGCIDCGYDEHPAALVFDHRDPETKSFRISTALSRSKASLEAEIAKCDVRCAICHAIRTFEEGHHTFGR